MGAVQHLFFDEAPQTRFAVWTWPEFQWPAGLSKVGHRRLPL